MYMRQSSEIVFPIFLLSSSSQHASVNTEKVSLSGRAVAQFPKYTPAAVLRKRPAAAPSISVAAEGVDK